MKKIIITLTLLLSLVPIQAICSTIPITSSDTNQIQQNCMVTILGPQQECDLTSYLDQFYPQLLTEENNYADAIAACKGDEVTYTALTDHPTGTEMESYLWTAIGGDITSNDNGESVTIKWGNGDFGQLQITVTLSDGSECTLTRNVVLISKPDLNTQTLPSYYIDENGDKIIEICKGGSVEFIDNSVNVQTIATGFLWESSISTESTRNYTLEDINTEMIVKHILTSFCGCDTTETFRIKLKDGKNLELSCYGTVCGGTAAKYTALNVACSPYVWIVDGGVITTGQGTPSVEVLWDNPASGYGTIGLDGAFCDENVCNSIMSVKIPILSDNIGIMGKKELCQGEFFKYSLPLWGSTYYDWTVQPSTGVTIVNGDNINERIITFDSNGVYTITVNYGCDFLGCVGFTSQVDTIHVLPRLVINGEKIVCLNSSYTYSTNEPDGILQWKILSPSGISQTSDGNTLSYQFLETGTYTITASSDNYCNEAVYYVEVNAPPEAISVGMIEGKHIVCRNNSLDLTISSGAGVGEGCHLEWAAPCSQATLTPISNNIFTVPYGDEVCNVNVFTVDNRTGCRSEAAVHTVTAFELASIVPETLYACPQSIMHLDAPLQDNVFYEWKVQPENRASVIGDKTEASVDVIVNTMENGIYAPFVLSLVRHYCYGLKDSVAYNVVVGENNAVVTINPASSCQGEAVTLTATCANCGTSFEAESWKVGGINIGSSNPISHTFTQAGNIPIDLTYNTNDNTHFCNNLHATSLIHIIRKPSFVIVRNGNILSREMNYDSENTATSPYSYSWTYDGTPVSTTMTCPIIGTGEYCLTITNNLTGCDNKVCKKILDDCEQSTMITDVCGAVVRIELEDVGCEWIITTDDENAQITQLSSTMFRVEYTTVGYHVIEATTNDECDNCHYASKTILVQYILNVSARYDCENSRIVVTDNSYYYDPAFEGSRTLYFNFNNADYAMLPGAYTYNINNIVLPTVETNFIITARIEDCGYSVSTLLTLYPGASILRINPDRTNLCADVPFEFSADVSGVVNTYFWDFGDGSVTSNFSQSHTFSTLYGDYYVKLLIFDGNGCPVSLVRQYTVKQDVLKAGSLIPENNVDLCSGDNRYIWYINTSDNNNVFNNINSYTWRPTPTPSNLTGNAYEYNTHYTGDYSVRVVDVNGCIGEGEVNVGFFDKPLVLIKDIEKHCTGEEIHFSCFTHNSYISYDWTLTKAGTTVSLTNPHSTDPYFVPSTDGDYTISLTIHNQNCEETATMTFHVYKTPAPPVLSFGENSCICKPPVNLVSDRYASWSNGSLGNQANYYSAGYATAFIVDQNSGCRSDTSRIYITHAPNFDALLTGCYTRCLPDTLPVYMLSPDGLKWVWSLEGGWIANGTNNHNIYLPLPQYGNYSMNVRFGDNCEIESPTLTIEEDDMCGCDSIQVMPLGKDECYIKDCQLYYTLTMEVTNQSSAPVIFDQISTMSGVTVISSPLPLTIGAGATAFVQIGFRLTNLQISHIAFSLISTSLDCEREISMPIDFSACVGTDCEIKLDEILYNPTISSPNASAAFKFKLTLPTGTNSVLGVYSEPSQVVDYDATSLPTVTGLLVLDYGRLQQMQESGDSVVCIHVLICDDDKLCLAVVCVKVKDLLDQIVNGAKTSRQDFGRMSDVGQSEPYLVPNPAGNEVRVVGIEANSIETLTLIDMNGKVLLSVSGKNTMDIHTISKGYYILKIKSTDGIYYLKLIKA